MGGMVTLRVGGAKRYIRLKASDVPKGTIVIATPGGTTQGMGWEIIRPPKGRKAGVDAATGIGAATTAASANVAASVA